MVDDRLVPKLFGRAPNVMGAPTGHGATLRKFSARRDSNPCLSPATRAGQRAAAASDGCSTFTVWWTAGE